MAVKTRNSRDGASRILFIDISYRTADGHTERYRRDAQLQTKSGAEAEHRRLIAELKNTGTLKHGSEVPASDARPAAYSFKDAVRQFRATRMATLKPSTRISYEVQLTTTLVPRFGERNIAELADTQTLVALDAELARDGLKPGTRLKTHIVFRSVMNVAFAAGMLASKATYPRLPSTGRKLMPEFRRDDLEAILGEASVEQRLAFALAAYAGLRAGEVRGLRWPDVDLTGNTLTVRRAMTRGEESTPKSGHQRRVPFAEPLRGLLLHAQSVRSGPWATVALTGHGKPWRDFGLNQAFKRVQERAGRSGWSFHDLRHYCATELFRLGVGAPTVQRILGHAELSTTQRYADMTERDLRAAVVLLGNGLATSETEIAKAATPTTEK